MRAERGREGRRGEHRQGRASAGRADALAEDCGEDVAALCEGVRQLLSRAECQKGAEGARTCREARRRERTEKDLAESRARAEALAMEAKERKQEAFLAEQRMQRMGAIAKEQRVRQPSAPSLLSRGVATTKILQAKTSRHRATKAYGPGFAGEVSSCRVLCRL